MAKRLLAESAPIGPQGHSPESPKGRPTTVGSSTPLSASAPLSSPPLSPPILTVDDQIAGRIEPDLHSFKIEGLDEVWMNVNKRFVITAKPRFAEARPQDSTRELGGLWNVRIVFNIEGSVPIPVKVIRFGLDSAYFEYQPSLQGKWRIWLDVSGTPVPGSPFDLNVHWGSGSQINKWTNIDAFLKGDSTSTTLASLGALEVLFLEASAINSCQALEYRKSIFAVLTALPEEKSTEISKRISNSILVIKSGSILDDFPEIESIFVSHTSWMMWPKETGYQARLLGKLSDKEAKMVVDRTSKFGKTRLNYGSTLIIPVSLGLEQKKLVNTVTVLCKTKSGASGYGSASSPSGYKHTKEVDLRRALFLAFEEAERKGIKSIVLPSTISKNYFTGERNDEAIVTIIKEWIARRRTESPEGKLDESIGTSKLETICIAHKDPTPKIPRKKRFGSVRKRLSGHLSVPED